VTHWKGYDYRPNSTLVLQPETPRSKSSKEPTGEPESLKDKGLFAFGDRAGSSRPKSEGPVKKPKEQPKSKKRGAQSDINDRGSKRTKITALDQDEMEGIKYQPKGHATSIAYDSLLSFVRQRLGDQQQSVIMSAADEVLLVLKDDEIQAKEKHDVLNQLLQPLTSDQLADLYKISRAITDYADEVAPGGDADENISVVFGAEESDDEGEQASEVDDSESDEVDQDVDIKESALGRAGDDGDEEANQDDLDPNAIDAFWLQRELGKFLEDAHKSQKIAEEVFAALERKGRIGDLENDLVGLLGYKHFDFVKLILNNRPKIVYCTKLGQADPATREKIEAEMANNPELAPILMALQGKGAKQGATIKAMQREQRALSKQQGKSEGKEEAMDIEEEHDQGHIDLEAISFQAGGHLMSNKQCKLPEGSFHKLKKGYEEVLIPAVKAPPATEEENVVYINKIPSWARPAFGKIPYLNRIQSKCYKSFFEGDENLLLCAPTGGGKTNCAMLAMLHEIGKHIVNKDTLECDVDSFKMIYVAPMKSLVQEMVQNFGDRLAPYGIKVAELSGDASMTKEQIDATQLIITTPEKWDIITRKAGDRTYTRLVRLIIIDEIHLLHDDRGPVLESIVARTLRQIESTQEMVRIVGLSATLPNYHDVATFLRVKPENRFAFPNSLRPIPLEQVYIGVSVKRPFKRFQMMNDICYEKVAELAGKSQVLVFVHSRKETVATAQMLRDKAIADNTIGRYLVSEGTREILRTEAENIKSNDLKELLPYGFAVHHAGLLKEDRTLIEDLFFNREIQVLVSTATLAWGVNLPAQTVIIKGTKIYSPEKGDWVELSPLDVMQMMGRAGRPGFDDRGKGILITGGQELQYYLSLLNEQLPIESQLIKRLADNLNAEIVLGTVQNVKEAITWLGYTYLYVCMLRSPTLYGIAPSELQNDTHLKKRRQDLIHSAATILAKNNLINYDRKSGAFQVTDLGRIASHYYIAHNSMSVYNEHLKPTTTDIELLKIFSMSNEFANVTVRPDEREELKRLLDRVPIPVKESIEEPSAKINVLFQAYISRLSLDGFSLASDMIFIRQSAGRLVRALFEIALKRGWAALAERCLYFSQMVDKRMWSTQSELRQFKTLDPRIVGVLERKHLTVEQLFPLDVHQVGDAIDNSGQRKNVFTLVHKFPRLDMTASVQPITRSLLKMELTITSQFTWDEQFHGNSLAFWVIVKDVDGELILHHEMFILKKRFATEEHNLSFTVPLFEPLPPQYFIKIIADRWLGSETMLPVSFRHLILPEKYPPHSDLLDLQPLPVGGLKNPAFESLYKEKFNYFNPIQTQVFECLYKGDQNTLLCAPNGSGKTICAEFAILREWAKEDPGKIVYIAPLATLARHREEEWSAKFEPLGKRVSLLTGEWNVDAKLLARSDIAIATAEHWDMNSRRWNKRKIIQNIKLYIFDEIHLIGSDDGPTLEIVVSRVRYIAEQLRLQLQETEKTKSKLSPTRIVALSTSLANAKDIGEWIGATSRTGSLFNFHPNVRPVPLEIHMQGFDNPSFKEQILSMNKLLLYSVSNHAEDKPVLIFVPSRKLARQVAQDIITHSVMEQTSKRFLHCTVKDLEPLFKHIESKALKEALSCGVGFYHEALTEGERDVVMRLWRSGAIQVMIATHAMTWDIHANAHLVVVMGTQYYEGKQHAYVDYPITKVLQMIGKAGRPGVDDSSKCIIFGHSKKKEFYKKFIYEPLPIESHLDHYLQDHLNAEIVTRTIENKQDAVDYLTWTFYYRRITQNPNYYNLQGVTHMVVSDHLSELIEDTIKDLEESKCVGVDDLDLTPLNLGIIASHYYVRSTTIELFNFSLTKTTKLKNLLHVLSNASEFEGLSIRHKEDEALEKLAAHLPLKISKPNYNSTATKVNILLQCYFSRRPLPPDLTSDQREILMVAPRLVQAMVDVISSNGWLAPALAAMELSQMLVQSMWVYDSHLRQLPHFTKEIVDRILKEEPKCEEISDLLELEDDRRNQLLGLTENQMSDVAQAVNRFPSIEMQYEVQDPTNIRHGGAISIVLQFNRDMEDDERLGPVYAPHYPSEKPEGWWCIVANPKSNLLLGIKRVTVGKSQVQDIIEFEAPEAGNHKLVLYFVCDSYFGADQEWEIDVNVGKANK